jgi:hypothetical protein
MGIGAADRMTYRRRAPLLAGTMGRWEDAVVYRPGPSD